MYFYLPKSCESYIPSDLSDHFISMRVRPGDRLTTTDLKGLKRIIEIIDVDKRSKSIKFNTLETTRYEKTKDQNILFQAVTDKGYLEKLVEIAPHANIDTIYLFSSARSPVSNFMIERLNRILARSCEQAQKVFMPVIREIETSDIDKLLAEYKPTVLELETKSTEFVPNTINTVLVGPEGGWTSEEIAKFKALDLPFDSLGDIVYPAWLAGYTWFAKLI
jgi:RsmE family RNA methyltransferase